MTYRKFSVALVLIFTSLFTTRGFTQNGSLNGIIMDAETATVLPGANIVIKSGDLETGTAANNKGAFELSLPGGNYTVEITFIGYQKKTLNDVSINAGQTRWLDIRLESTEIQINPVTVTASRRPEKLLDAPASVTVLETEAVENRTALTATEHLKALPGVDIFSAGLNQSRVVVRGFNDLFSGSLLSMVDNRITRIPAVRLNAFQVIPTSNLDVDRIEVVSGPASALYGPNSANGVMHVLTKSPFDSKGTTISVGGGERDVFIGTLRHANSLGNILGYKLSFQHYRGTDFKSMDPVEENFRSFAILNGANEDSLRIGARIFDIKSTAFDARFDLRFSPDFTFIFNSGFSKGDNIELTNQGAAQALGASFNYYQGRLRYKRLFFQAFLNSVNSGDTYFLRSGDTIINDSKLYVAQLQHTSLLGEQQTFTYGFDALLTRPITDGTVNGINEDDDDVNEFGVYLQSETTLTQKLKFLAAIRLDDHNRLDGINFSPRAALVFKPTPKDNFRFTVNRAFTTPTSDMLFSDNTVPSPANPSLVPFVGDTFLRIRALGSPTSGFSFRRDATGNPLMIPTFTEIYGGDYVSTNVNEVWAGLRQLLIATALSDSMRIFFEMGLPIELNETVPGVLGFLDTESTLGNYMAVDEVQDVAPISESVNTTLEVGYKGLINKKLLASLDVYHTRINDFIGPITVASPNVYIDTDSLLAVVRPVLENNVQGTDFEQFLPLASFTIRGLSNLPIGIVSPQEIANGKDVVLTYRNLGDLSVTGADFSLTYHFNNQWAFTGNYSFVNRDLFRSSDGRSDIALNAPKHKVGAMVDYRNPKIGFNGNLRLRFVDSFPVRSGTFREPVDRYAVFDLNANYDLPFSHNTRVSLMVQNLTNNKHKEFAGVPEIGRLAWMRLTQTL